MLPVWAVDFVLARKTGLTDWAWKENYVAFMWKNGAWMRSTLVVGKFPEKAASMIRSVEKEKTSHVITSEFRDAFKEVAEMAEDTITVSADNLKSLFKKAEIVANVKCIVPSESEHSIWGASYMLPVIRAANSWSPDMWPKPAPFKGDIVCGYVVGRRA
jgi:hypothetical protein